MTSWRPRLWIERDATFSDDCGPDAEGRVVHFECGPFIVQLWLMTRPAQ
jgi:hypothetical protein